MYGEKILYLFLVGNRLGSLADFQLHGALKGLGELRLILSSNSLKSTFFIIDSYSDVVL